MGETDCLFCKIIAGEIPSEKVAETDRYLAFRDINPQAPTHVLVISKTHTPSVSETEDESVFADVLVGVRDVARSMKLENYRVAINNGAGAGQSVFHVHAHLLSGRAFQWPPG